MEKVKLEDIPIDPKEYWKKYPPKKRQSTLINTRILKDARFTREWKNKKT
tara:strand:+ start:362 stop:511 length:150 start_codon:yes stop_codon:yes gene_type:complete